MAALDIDGILRNDCSSPIAVALPAAPIPKRRVPLLPITEPNITTMWQSREDPCSEAGRILWRSPGVMKSVVRQRLNYLGDSLQWSFEIGLGIPERGMLYVVRLTSRPAGSLSVTR